MFDSVIYARRRELLNMKVSQWKPFLQRLDHSLRSNLDVNATCLRDMRSFVDAVMQRSAAGLELLDSLGSLPSGILRGSLVDEGSYKGCFSANVTDKNGRFVSRKFCDIVVFILGLFVATVALATLTDMLNPAKSTSEDTAYGSSNTDKDLKERFRRLSVVYTLREAFRLDTSNDARLDVFNGLRALTMVWVIVLHTHLYVEETLLEFP
ncbi:hypothetical protein HPB52_017549 [Rhipicephalus sanguineus]|uniref:Nose resistant-to-fluoxetine protein N-terminal domain-containing protein n=1 Tax=Rhipicephalus sanguineus TaxID=34632 RepID=A0A9D4QH46_RHISA|nr:hypothetical protein HPB52_017549 [Rhipicephalus sanguineus]